MRVERITDFKPFPPLMIGWKDFPLLIVCIVPSRFASKKDCFKKPVRI
tara:strand:- start:206 stop:349 length:144 start_codon:yes stop_codon:yes gene_type:complete